MRLARTAAVTLFLAVALPGGRAGAAEAPPWLPRYDLAMHLDVAAHRAAVVERVTWLNRHRRPAQELVFNVHSHYTVPTDPVGRLFLAKMLEIMRVPASEGMYGDEPPCRVEKVYLFHPDGRRTELPFQFRPDLATALVVTLPEPVQTNQAVTVDLQFAFHFPQKQGRWGQWKGVTFLSNWHPVLAYYDEGGWQPTPFVPWHQPFFNEACVIRAHVRLPAGQRVGCTGSVASAEQKGEWQEVRVGPVTARCFDFLCSDRFQEEVVARAGPVKVKCLAFPEHQHYAKAIVAISARAVEAYGKWFGPYPYPELTFVESYFGWNGNECAGLVMIDERVFGMPHLAEGYVEYLVSHETCHQWWYNVIGTDGYRETFMDEAFATYFAHRLLNEVHGRNNAFLKWPSALGWLPNIERENYRYSGFYSTVRRGELDPPLQEMEKYRHIGRLFSGAYDRGSKVVGMIEDRLGEAAFFDFMRRIYSRYYFRVLKADDFLRELEEYTGRPWGDFWQNWLHTAGLTEWSVERVKVEALPKKSPPPGRGIVRSTAAGGLAPEQASHRATVTLRQRGEIDEPTVLGVSLDGAESYPIRVPVVPRAEPYTIDEPPARIEPLPDGRVRVELFVPGKPKQIVVDPDQVLPDREPANNFWKTPINYRLTPIYTMLDETALTTAYDRWNVIAGPWMFSPSYPDPWFTRAQIAGARVGLYRTEEFVGGVYAGYRPDFRDVAAGVDARWKHLPLPKMEVGFNAEKSLFKVREGGTDIDRAVVYTRYVFTDTSSLYLPPIHHMELFGSYQRNFLPFPRNPIPGTMRFDEQANLGVHYHIDLLTPYWDAERGFKFDGTYATGMGIDRAGSINQVLGQLSWATRPPEWTGPLARTKFAFRLYGAAATPNDALLFTLGGNLLFRGFDLAERQGSSMWIGSAEWRIPIVDQVEWDCLDHVAGLRSLYVVPFYDVGNAYVSGHPTGPIAHAVGAGLRADVAWFSFIERTTFRLDFAKTINEATPLQIWFGFQHPF